MIADLDIWRAADLLVKRHGADAAMAAAERADEMLAEGNLDGCAIWKTRLELSQQGAGRVGFGNQDPEVY